ncbi:plant intracellular Ras-group-related LRR protein 4-like [Punica granatum]|uniref:Plant intracellular Ras-group-related LRR protein 4-like n=1 Tax=Punica granatum TaxID=22663 RepID=A0A6P8BT15_PUNGR|nr:plant intracellular Ras-group-related LRR protein 4-like [Punica granatum]
MKLPDSIGDLKSLVELSISMKEIAELPERIGNLKKLEVIKMLGCSVTKLSDSVGNLKSLVELNISLSQIAELPNTLSHSKKLVFKMKDCGITRLLDLIGGPQVAEAGKVNAEHGDYFLQGCRKMRLESDREAQEEAR